MSDTERRRSRRLARYERLRSERPHLFDHPDDANPQILFDPADQERVANDCAAKYEAAGIPVDCADIGVVYEDPYVLVIRDAVRFASGKENSYVRVLGTGDGVGAAVLPLTDDGRIALVRHFRHDDRSWRWEIPRGFGELGSDGAKTAARELTEELGVTATGLSFLGKLSEDEIYVAYLDGDARAMLDKRGESMVDADEGIDGFRLVTFSRFRDMMIAGEIVDSYTLAAFAFAVARDMLPVDASKRSEGRRVTEADTAAERAPRLRLVTEREVFTNRFISVYDDDVALVDGEWTGRFLRIVESGGRPGVAVLASCRDRYALVQVYRYALGTWEWGIPRGFAHSDDPVETARQELREEVGEEPDDLVSLGIVAPNSGMLASRVHLFFARYKSEIAAPTDTQEVAAIRWITARSMMAEIAEGRIVDGFTMSAVAAAAARGLICR